MLASLALALGCIAGRADAPSSDQWRADLRYLAAEMPRVHPNLFRRLSRAAFDSAVAALDQRIPSLDCPGVLVGIARIVARIGDGHTFFDLVSGYSGVRFQIYPLVLYAFKDGLYVQAADPVHAELVGGRVTRIGSRPADSVFAAAAELIDAENPMWTRRWAPGLLVSPEVLHALGVVQDTALARFTVVKRDHEVTVELAPWSGARPMVHNGIVMAKGWVDVRDGAGRSPPLWQRDPHDAYWYRYLAPSRAVYVQYNEVGDKDTETVAHFFDRVAAFVNRHQVDRLVLDLRMNGGGDNTLNAAVVRAIGRMPAIDRRGHFFSIIGRHTFSAAQNLVNALEKYTDVIFVGEPTGSPPNMYGDATPVRLPNSGVSVYVSTVWWQDLDQRDRRWWTAPEIAAELTAEDFRENRDPALEAALTAAPEPALADRMLEPLERGDTALARQRYETYVADARHAYVDTERALVALAGRVAQAHRPAPAVWALELNAAEHPGSGEAYENLGEAYALLGRTDLAAASFERALALDPRNFEAKRRLRELREPS